MAIHHYLHVILPFLLTSVYAVDFIFNSFDSSDLLIYGNAILEFHILTLTKASNLSLGRFLYPFKIPTREYPNSSLLSFFISFIFSIAPVPNYEPGHGFVFIFTPSTDIHGVSSSQHPGLFNRTNDGNPNNHMFGIEFNFFQNQQFNDIDSNHVDVNLNSLRSSTTQPACYWDDNLDPSFKGLTLNNGVNYQAWIDYFDSQLNVRPQRPLDTTSLDVVANPSNEGEIYPRFRSLPPLIERKEKGLAGRIFEGYL